MTKRVELITSLDLPTPTGDDTSYDVDADTAKDFGVGDFFIEMDITGKDVPVTQSIGTTLYASKVRIQHNGEGLINIMEVEVYSSGTNVALQGTAELSSTYSSPNYDLVASTAIDGLTSNGYKFAHSDDEYGTRDVAQRHWHSSQLETH